MRILQGGSRHPEHLLVGVAAADGDARLRAVVYGLRASIRGVVRRRVRHVRLCRVSRVRPRRAASSARSDAPLESVRVLAGAAPARAELRHNKDETHRSRRHAAVVGGRRALPHATRRPQVHHHEDWRRRRRRRRAALASFQHRFESRPRRHRRARSRIRRRCSFLLIRRFPPETSTRRRLSTLSLRATCRPRRRRRRSNAAAARRRHRHRRRLPPRPAPSDYRIPK